MKTLIQDRVVNLIHEYQEYKNQPTKRAAKHIARTVESIAHTVDTELKPNVLGVLGQVMCDVSNLTRSAAASRIQNWSHTSSAHAYIRQLMDEARYLFIHDVKQLVDAIADHTESLSSIGRRNRRSIHLDNIPNDSHIEIRVTPNKNAHIAAIIKLLEDNQRLITKLIEAL